MVSVLSRCTRNRPLALLPKPGSPLVLRIVGGEYDNRSIELVSPKISIGSAANCTLRLVGCGLRPVELFVLCGPTATSVQNWSPRNTLNGRAFADAQLTAGDCLTVGPIQFEVTSAASAGRLPNDTNAATKAHSISDGAPTQSLTSDQSPEQFQALLAEHRSDAALWQAEREQWIDELAKSRHHAIALQTELEQYRAKENEASSELQVELELARDQLAHDAELLQNQSAELEKLRQRADRATEELAVAEDRALQLNREAAEMRSQLERQSPPANQSGEASDELARRFAELESREEQLLERREELERAAAKLMALQTQHAEAEAAAVKRPQPTLAGDDSRRVSQQNEQALAELLRVRQDLDQRRAELQQWENHLAEREAELDSHRVSSKTTPENPTIEVGRATGGAAPADHSGSHTIILSDLEGSAQTIADRLLNDEPYEEELHPTIAVPSRLHTESELDEESFQHDDGEIVLTSENDAVRAADEPAKAACSNDQYFTPPKTGAPVSAAEILAKYTGHNYLADDDDAVEPPPEEQQPAPAEVTLAATSQATPSSDLTADDDDSIRDYMDQLMRRVRGQSPETPAPTPSTVTQAKPAAQPVENASPLRVEPASVACEVLTSSQFMPRSTAPERTDHLAKMRELANTSARSAIDQASKVRRAQTAGIHLTMAFAAAGAGVALIGFIGGGLAIVRYGTALAAFGLAGWWGYQAVRYALGRQALPAHSFIDLCKQMRRPKQAAQLKSHVNDATADEPVADSEDPR